MDQENNEEANLKRISEVDHKKKINELSAEFDHAIKFMDCSFEKAFDKKEKDFMLAYRVTIFLFLIIYCCYYSNMYNKFKGR
jgi:hypothetical protein